MSFKKPQWNLYKVDTIGAWLKCLHYGDVHLKSPSKNQNSSKVNMKSTICHVFPSSDLLEGPKDWEIKENAKKNFILKSSNKVDYISTLNYLSQSTHYL